VKPDRPARELVERIIQAAVLAPNHHKTIPWRFVVLAGRVREELGEVMAASLRARLPDAEGEQARSLLEKERHKPLRAPVLIAVAVVPSRAPKVVEIEEVEAGAAGVENMLLAAQALGLGAMWRTGEAAYDPAVKRFLGLLENAHIVSFVYLGYPDLPDLTPRERDAADLTTWLGWDE
jgi:nitroreductase